MTTAASVTTCGTTILAGMSLAATHSLDADFAHPPRVYRPTALYHLNDTISNDVVDQQLTNFRDKDGYGSIAILPIKEYWEPDFLDKYGHLLDKLDSLGMWVIFCDDKSFPSGSAGGVIARKHPELCARQLYKSEVDVTGPCTHRDTIPPGTLMACVAMDNRDHSRRIDITSRVKDGVLTWEVPDGSWKAMTFVTRRTTDVIDYLNPTAVDKWIELTYQRFHDRFPRHFGTTIKSSFYDDISLYQANPGPDPWGGDSHPCWTDGMNARFVKKYGIDPAVLYPALWHDIGAETSAARAMLFGLRAELLADIFVKRVADWCTAHGIDASGHPAGDYDPSPMAFSADAIKFYKHAQRPLVDVIFYHGHGRNGYKLASSAANLYDRPLTQCETFGAFYQQQPEARFTPDLLYRTSMELFTRGINLIIPHGVWYQYPGKIIPHEISWRNTTLGPALPAWSTWTARCQLLLQGGRHIADIAVLYPIAGIMADCHFGSEKTTSDYQEIGNRLTTKIRRDFTYVHPEVLDEKCTVKDGTLRLNNKVNFERYKVLIIPGRSLRGTINVSTLRKAKAFFDAGGTVICTSRLPSSSAEPGQDAVVRALIVGIFGVDPAVEHPVYTRRTNAKRGTACFIPHIDELVEGTDQLSAALDQAIDVPDVRFEGPLPDAEVTYIHKVRDGHDCYYFANSSDAGVDTRVHLRGKLTPRIMDPHTGTIVDAPFQHTTEHGRNVTVVTLRLDPVSSVFVWNAAPGEAD